MRIRDVVPEDAAKLVQLRQSLSAETDFMLHGTGEYNSTEQEVASQKFALLNFRRVEISLPSRTIRLSPFSP